MCAIKLPCGLPFPSKHGNSKKPSASTIRSLLVVSRKNHPSPLKQKRVVLSIQGYKCVTDCTFFYKWRMIFPISYFRRRTETTVLQIFQNKNVPSDAIFHRIRIIHVPSEFIQRFYMQPFDLTIRSAHHISNL